MSIKIKTIIMSTIIMSLLLILGGAGVYAVGQLGESVSTLSKQSLPAVRNMTLVDMMHDGASAAVYKSIVLGPEGKEETLKEYQETFESMNTYMGEIEKLKLGGKTDATIGKAKEAIKKYQADGKLVVDAAVSGDRVKADANLPQFIKSFEFLEQELGVIGEEIEKEAGASSEISLAKSEDLKQKLIYFLIFSVIVSALISFIAYKFISGLTTNLIGITQGLKSETEMIVDTSQSLAAVAGKLSEASTEQAASLQETVASIDEISAMITRNSDSAQTSAKMSEQSRTIAQKGKLKSEQMLDSIAAISSGNDEIINQMQKSNSEITEIVQVIQDISQKTQVINDIVFQTKLLSFNASVEAARAGEHGKGFAVVAEEVGNLASMSGKAATEITDMLTKSVKRVTDIVDGTKGLMDNMIAQSKEKVHSGTATAHECTEALTEILANVSSVNEMIKEISVASQEQDTGVREVNKAMSELDQVTQSNSGIAQDSSKAAGTLQSQADRLNALVSELTGIVGGKAVAKVKDKVKAKVNIKTEVKRTPPSAPVELKIVHTEVPKKAAPPRPKSSKKETGISFEAPSSDDSRFTDV
jgi:methyl-accepting chemotaxis protein